MLVLGFFDDLSEDIKYYVDDGCHSEKDGTPDNFPGSFMPKSFQAGVRCCDSDTKTCMTPLYCPYNDTSFDEAASRCASLGLRLCTKDELLSDICCETGGECDNYLVWTSTQESESGI